MQNKRGQVYIISAIIIILIIVGLAGITNKTTYKQEPVKFYELGKQLSSESFILSAYGEYSNQSAQKIIENFTQGAFSTYIQPTGAEFIVIYGNKDSVTYNRFQRLPSEGIDISLGSEQSSYAQGPLRLIENQTIASPGTSARITFQGQNYTIDLGQNQGYYYVFTQNEGADTFTYQG